MQMHNSSRSNSVDFGVVQTLVNQGRTVISSEDSALVEWTIQALTGGRTATLYLKPTVFEAIRRWYWTPERIKLVGLRPVSEEQSRRVRSDFDLEIDGYANSIDCPRCGHPYSTYEFIQQGIEDHGEEFVRTAFLLKQVAILELNPVQNTICRNCRLRILSSGDVESELRLQDEDASQLRAPVSRAIRIHYHYDYACNDGSAYACCNDYVVVAAAALRASP